MKWLALEYHTTLEGGVIASYCLMREKKSARELLDETGSGSLDEVLHKHGALPIRLHLSGKGVLDKVLSVPSSDSTTWIQAALPGANPTDFAASSYQLDDQVIVSVVRKSVVDNVLAALQEKGAQVATVGIGLAHLATLHPLNLSSRLPYHGKALTLDNGKWQASAGETTSQPLELDGHTLQPAELPAVAAGIHLATENYNTHNLPAELDEAASEISYKQKINTWGKAILIGMLALLIGNYFLFQHLSQDVARLSREYAANATTFTQVEELQRDISEKEEMIRFSGLNKPPEMGLFADKLAAQMPATLQLKELAIVPLKEKLDERKPLEFDFSSIRIIGETTSTADLNTWMERIENMDQLGAAELISFSRVSASRSAFEIKIDWP